jgi:hypothetical protein
VGHLLSRLRRALVQYLPDQLLEQLLHCACHAVSVVSCVSCARRVRT